MTTKIHTLSVALLTIFSVATAHAQSSEDFSLKGVRLSEATTDASSNDFVVQAGTEELPAEGCSEDFQLRAAVAATHTRCDGTVAQAQVSEPTPDPTPAPSLGSSASETSSQTLTATVTESSSGGGGSSGVGHRGSGDGDGGASVASASESNAYAIKGEEVVDAAFYQQAEGVVVHDRIVEPTLVPFSLSTSKMLSRQSKTIIDTEPFNHPAGQTLVAGFEQHEPINISMLNQTNGLAQIPILILIIMGFILIALRHSHSLTIRT